MTIIIKITIKYQHIDAVRYMFSWDTKQKYKKYEKQFQS